MGGCGHSCVVGGVIIREDGPVLGQDVKEMNSADLNSTSEVLVGCGHRHTHRQRDNYCSRQQTQCYAQQLTLYIV